MLARVMDLHDCQNDTPNALRFRSQIVCNAAIEHTWLCTSQRQHFIHRLYENAPYSGGWLTITIDHHKSAEASQLAHPDQVKSVDNKDIDGLIWRITCLLRLLQNSWLHIAQRRLLTTSVGWKIARSPVIFAIIAVELFKVQRSQSRRLHTTVSRFRGTQSKM